MVCLPLQVARRRLSAKERQRRRREQLKEDPVAYALHKEQERERKKIKRIFMTPQEIEAVRARERESTRRYREKYAVPSLKKLQEMQHQKMRCAELNRQYMEERKTTTSSETEKHKKALQERKRERKRKQGKIDQITRQVEGHEVDNSCGDHVRTDPMGIVAMSTNPYTWTTNHPVQTEATTLGYTAMPVHHNPAMQVHPVMQVHQAHVQPVMQVHQAHVQPVMPVHHAPMPCHSGTMPPLATHTTMQFQHM